MRWRRSTRRPPRVAMPVKIGGAVVIVVTIVAVTIVADRVLINREHLPYRDILTTEIPSSPVVTPPLSQAEILTRRVVSVAKDRASAYWDGTRCRTIRYLYRTLAERRVAEAKWYAQTLASKEYLNCSITFNTDPRKVKISFWHYCAALVHEFGHLHGFHEHGGPDGGVHSRDPTNIMYPVLTSRNIPRTCKENVAALRLPWEAAVVLFKM
jgi:hypothetical protein